MTTEIKDIYPKEIIEEMTSYDSVLNEAITKKSETLLPNSGENHASLMMTKMFENTRKELYLVVGCFDGAVSNKPNYQEALKTCLYEKKVKAHVLILGSEKVGEPKADSLAYNVFLKCREERPDDIEIFYATNATKSFLREAFSHLNNIPNFALFDDDIMRFEVTPATYSGWGSFNNPESVKDLKEVFVDAIDTAKK